MTRSVELTSAQTRALALLDQGWRFQPGHRWAFDPPPGWNGKGFIMRAIAPADQGLPPRPLPAVEQATLFSLVRHGYARRLPGPAETYARAVSTEETSPAARMLSLLREGWRIRKGDAYVPDLCPGFRGARLDVEPPPHVSPAKLPAVYQSTADKLVREGVLRVTSGGYFVPARIAL